MALVVVATPGAADANSYITSVEADSYHEARLHSDSWTGASATNKDAAIVWATRLLDIHMDWEGTKSDILQALRFPRLGTRDRDGELYDSTIIPQPLKDATAELARLLILADRGIETGTEGLESLKAGSVGLAFDKSDRIGTIPDEVYQMVVSLGALNSVKATGTIGEVPLVRV